MKSVVILLLIIGLNGVFSLSGYRSHIHVDQKMSWREAQRYCRLHYDDLSAFSNRKENDIFTKCNAVTDCREGRWIGLHTDKSSKNSVWRWSGDEEETTFTSWAVNEPNYSGPNNCTKQDSKTGEWYSSSCSLNLTFFCMVHSPQLVLLQKNMTWEDALDYCRDHGADLASMKSSQENALAVRKGLAAEVSYVWIGLHFVVRHWIWMDGHALEYTTWSADAYPTCPVRNLRCGALETNKGIWTPIDCGEKHYFLCFKK